jgi:hypothetical protein
MPAGPVFAHAARRCHGRDDMITSGATTSNITILIETIDTSDGAAGLQM